MNEMVIYVKDYKDIPKGFTGKVIWTSGTIWICKLGNCHSESGPALFYSYGPKHYYLYGEYHSKDDWFNKLTDKQKIKALMSPVNFE